MSIRRKAGDWVWLMPNVGFVSESNRLKAEIRPEMDSEPCFLCDDPDCREWATLWTEPAPPEYLEHSGKRWPLYHVSECQMLDLPFEETDLKGHGNANRENRQH